MSHATRLIRPEANDQPAIEAIIGDRYELIDELSHHDRLCRALPAEPMG